MVRDLQLEIARSRIWILMATRHQSRCSRKPNEVMGGDDEIDEEEINKDEININTRTGIRQDDKIRLVWVNPDDPEGL